MAQAAPFAPAVAAAGDPLANATVIGDSNRDRRDSLSNEEIEARLAAARSGRTLQEQPPTLGEALGKVFQVFRKGEFNRVECLRESCLYAITVGTGLSFTYYFLKRRANPAVHVFFGSSLLTSFVTWTACRTKVEMIRQFMKENRKTVELITTDKTDEFLERQKELGVFRKLTDEDLDKIYGENKRPPPANAPDRLR